MSVWVIVRNLAMNEMENPWRVLSTRMTKSVLCFCCCCCCFVLFEKRQELSSRKADRSGMGLLQGSRGHKMWPAQSFQQWDRWIKVWICTEGRDTLDLLINQIMGMAEKEQSRMILAFRLSKWKDGCHLSEWTSPWEEEVWGGKIKYWVNF